jgi:triacylglycerol lipase
MYLPPAFDRSIASEAAALVLQAYAQYERGNAWSLPGNYDELGRLFARPEWDPSSEAFGFVARNRTSGVVFAVYRGTESPQDWIADFSFPQVAHPLGNVERGFFGVYAQTAASVAAAILRAGATPHVVVTGHSLGAALAVLAAADIAGSGAAAQTELYSFAGPRVGDLAFAAGFNSRLAGAWRIVNTEDLVTTVPLATPAFSSGIVPRNPLTFLNNLGQNLDYEHVGSPVAFSTHTGSIAGNHDMQVYIAALNAAAPAANLARAQVA